MSRPAIHIIDPHSGVKLPGSAYDGERAILGYCLIAPDNIGSVSSKVTEADFEDAFVASCMQAMVYLHREGRRPSVLSLLAEINDPDGSAKRFLLALVSEIIHQPPLPLDDAIGLIRDRAVRRKLIDVGQTLVASAISFTRPVLEVGADTSDALDEALCMVRDDRRQSFDAAGCGDEVFAYLDNPDEGLVTTGNEDLDRIIGGLPKGQLTILAGRTGMGKTAVGIQFLLAAARSGAGCLYWSAEMTTTQLGARLLTNIAYTRDRPILYENIFKRTLIDNERDRLDRARKEAAELPIRIEEQSNASVAEVTARARKIAAEFARSSKSLDVVIVDHMSLLKPATRYAGNRTHEISDISNGLRVLAKDLNVAVVALCQLNRAVEGRPDKRPTKADLRDSGEIEEDASNVLLLYRPYYYLAQEKPTDPEAQQAVAAALEKSRNVLEIIIDKNRNGQAPVTVEAWVDMGANAVRRKAFGAGGKR